MDNIRTYVENKCEECGENISPVVTEYEDDGKTPKVATVNCGACGFYKKYTVTYIPRRWSL